MKILFLNFWASKPGGAEHSLVDIIRCISNSHQTLLITSEPGFLTDKAAISGCKCCILPFKQDLAPFRRQQLITSTLLHADTLFAFLKYCFAVRQKVISEKPDIIHANVPKSHILLHFLIITGFKGKAVFHLREIFDKNSIVYLLYSILFRINKASVIAISQAVLNSLPSSMKRRASVIYNGISVPILVPETKRVARPPSFLYLGRVVPWKGCDLLIDAFNFLFLKYPTRSGHLSIVGGTYYWDISYRKSLRVKINHLNLEKFISFRDHTDNTTELFLQHSILCVPSDNEPFGRVAAEAMAYGLPVIGFNSGGLAEVVKDKETGLLAEERTAVSLSDVMGHFLQYPDDVEKMGTMARKRCMSLFDINKQGPAIIKAIVS
ncbi:MAG TPA: glycosyltransferase family 4 protein [Chitinispirillaceae bacterium]|nr:glycosyltransferase family 4 protein [Chitinispirillaceae bacterium]